MDHGTALHLGSCLGHFDVVKGLLERGVNIHERDDEGQTPFQLAVVLSTGDHASAIGVWRAGCSGFN